MSKQATTGRRPRVVQISYACSPFQGSEPGVGWHRAVQAAQHCDVWVICEGSEFREPVNRYLQEHGRIEGLRVVFVDIPHRTGWKARLPGSFYLRYNSWHRQVRDVIAQLHGDMPFDLVHQSNMCGYREPGYGWTIDAPFVWGPVGGTQNFPPRLLIHAGWQGALPEATRSILNYCQLRCSRRVRQVAERASVLLAANTTIQRHLRETLGCDSRVILETGVDCRLFHGTAALLQDSDDIVLRDPREERHDKTLRILWSGEHFVRKSLSHLLEALAALPPAAAFRLRVIGDGAENKRWKRLAQRLGIHDRIEWTGWLSHHNALQQYHWADVFAFTSMRDTTGTVVLEALANGLPVVAPDHQGVGDLISDTCGFKVRVGRRKAMIECERDICAKIIDGSIDLAPLRRGALRKAVDCGWRNHGRRIVQVYRDVLGESFDWSKRTRTSESLEEVMV